MKALQTHSVGLVAEIHQRRTEIRTFSADHLQTDQIVSNKLQ